MALVPNANGVEVIRAAEGISIVDIGANRFTVGLQIRNERIFSNSLDASAPPPGLTQFAIGPPSFSTIYEGPYILTLGVKVGQGAGAIVAGPDDRFVFLLRNLADNATLISVPIPIYNRAAEDVQSQGTSASPIVSLTFAENYYAMLLQYNTSGTLSYTQSVVAFTLTPLCSTLPLVAPVA